jgi:hypothetical protein
VSWPLEQKLEAKLKNKIQHKYKCAQVVLCIHVSFACNQQLAYCRVTMLGSDMQSGVLASRAEIRSKVKKQNTTQNQ